jgi:hypothetical protein
MHLGVIGLAPVRDRFILLEVSEDTSKDVSHIFVSREIPTDVYTGEQSQKTSDC